MKAVQAPAIALLPITSFAGAIGLCRATRLDAGRKAADARGHPGRGQRPARDAGRSWGAMLLPRIPPISRRMGDQFRFVRTSLARTAWFHALKKSACEE